MHVLLEAEKEVNSRTGNKFLELFTVPRNRRATLASAIVMFMQQFCGINAIAYYSSNIFVQGGFSRTSTLVDIAAYTLDKGEKADKLLVGWYGPDDPDVRAFLYMA